jgi:hypothetical protein
LDAHLSICSWFPALVRGDALVAMRRAWIAQGFDMTSIILVPVDGAGRAVWSAIFDVDDLDAAMAELDGRAAATSPE